MRIFKEFRDTTNSSVYKKLRKEYYASCSFCKWHGHCSENDSWPDYHVFVRGNRKGQGKFPNWKLVSKNRRQWMKKSLRVNSRWNGDHAFYRDRAAIKWSAYDGQRRGWF